MLFGCDRHAPSRESRGRRSVHRSSISESSGIDHDPSH